MYLDLDIGFLFLTLNGIVTILCGGILLYFISSKRLEKHPFYYCWSLGFILYGTQISLRPYHKMFFFEAIMMTLALFFFLLGIWSLSRRKNRLYLTIVYLSSFSLLVALHFTRILSLETVLVIGPFVYFLPVSIAILYQRIIFGRSVDNFVIGWFLLFLSNLFLWGKGWVIDGFAIFSKIVLLRGIMDQDFVIIAEKVRKELSIRPIPEYTGERKEGGIHLISSSSLSYLKTIRWIEEKVRKNLNEGLDTIIFSFQNVIPYRELRRMKWINPEKVSIFIFSNSAEIVKKEFTVLPVGVTEVGTTLSEVTKKYHNHEGGCTIVLTNLSLLIYLFEAYPLYNMLLNKLGSLREEGIDLFAFIHPKTHSDKSTVALFENISDEVIKL